MARRAFDDNKRNRRADETEKWRAEHDPDYSSSSERWQTPATDYMVKNKRARYVAPPAATDAEQGSTDPRLAAPPAAVSFGRLDAALGGGKADFDQYASQFAAADVNGQSAEGIDPVAALLAEELADEYRSADEKVTRPRRRRGDLSWSSCAVRLSRSGYGARRISKLLNAPLSTVEKVIKKSKI